MATKGQGQRCFNILKGVSSIPNWGKQKLDRYGKGSGVATAMFSPEPNLRVEDYEGHKGKVQDWI